METFEQRVARLKETAREVRFRVVDMIHAAQSGHPGGSLSAADIMTALYFDVLRVDPATPSDPDRDRFVMSKGHACPVYYACLALRGFFPVEELRTLRRFESRLQGHPVQGKLPGIDVSTGSLGVGFGEAVGMALEARLLGRGHTVWVVMGDGEQQEGVVWETAAAASRFHLDNLVAVVDVNGLQNDGFVDEIMPGGAAGREVPRLRVAGGAHRRQPHGGGACPRWSGRAPTAARRTASSRRRGRDAG